jgi:hypothetical protein
MIQQGVPEAIWIRPAAEELIIQLDDRPAAEAVDQQPLIAYFWCGF